MTRSMNPRFLMIAALACAILSVPACSDRSSQDGTASMPLPDEENTAIFAGGCFWCMEPPFEKLDGVLEVESGYTGGTGTSPVYEDYAEKGHVEAVRISFDPSRITYAQLLEVLWRQIDPTDSDGQFVDRGPEYRPVVFYRNEEQRLTAERSLEGLEESGRYDEPITLEILPFSQFWSAEEYHQDYYRKNPVRYKFYRSRSGRDAYLEKVWGEDRHYIPETLALSNYP